MKNFDQSILQPSVWILLSVGENGPEQFLETLLMLLLSQLGPKSFSLGFILYDPLELSPCHLYGRL